MKLGSDPQSKLVLSALELAVLAALARRLGADGQTLAAQADRARVAMRSHSGVGFVTRLEVPEDVAELPAHAAGRVGIIHARHPQLAEPAEFLVQLKGGRLATIEAFCHEGMWPADDAGFRVEPVERGASR